MANKAGRLSRLNYVGYSRLKTLCEVVKMTLESNMGDKEVRSCLLNVMKSQMDELSKEYPDFEKISNSTSIEALRKEGIIET